MGCALHGVPSKETTVTPTTKLARKTRPLHVRDVMTSEPVCLTTGDSLRDVGR